MMTSKKIIKLKSSDNEIFEVEEDVARMSKLLKGMIEDDFVDFAIPISEVKGEILSKVIEYCKKHVENSNNNGNGDKELESWDAEFAKVDNDTLFGLIMAANYLEIKSLLDLMCRNVVNTIESKKLEEIREFYNIKNDFNPQEEAEMRKEYAWALEED